MLSAPATIPATIAESFPAGFDPIEVGRSTFSATIPGRSHDSASRITGSRPAHDTRFGSSNEARTTGVPCRNLIPQVPSRTGMWKPRQLPFSQFRGHLHARHTHFYRNQSVDRGSGNRATINVTVRLLSAIRFGSNEPLPIQADKSSETWNVQLKTATLGGWKVCRITIADPILISGR